MFIKEQIQSLQRGLTVDESFSSSRPLATLRRQVRPWPQRPALTLQSVPMSQRLTEGRKRPRVAGQGDCYALRQFWGGDGARSPHSLALTWAAPPPSSAPRWVKAAALVPQPSLPHFLAPGPSPAPQSNYLSGTSEIGRASCRERVSSPV